MMFPEANRAAGLITVATIGDSLERAVAERPDGEAIVFPDERATYSELAARTEMLARALLSLGVNPGDKVGILLPPCITNLAAFVAITKIGGVVVPINLRFKGRELHHVVRQSDMRVLLASTELDAFGEFTRAFPELVGATEELAQDEAPHLGHVVAYGPSPPPFACTAADFEALSDQVSPDELLARRYGVAVRDIAAIIYTSGTTAAPKGVMLTHEGLVRVAMMVARTRMGLTSNDRVWSVLPLFHIGGIIYAMACFDTAATYCHSGDFRPDTALRQLVEERCTVALAGFETIWIPILNQPTFDEADLVDLRIVFCLGVPERMREMQAVLPNAPLISTYGSTETASFFTLSDPADPVEARMTTTGQLLPGLRARVIDVDTGADLGPNEVGEILCGGWSRFEGYYNDPQATADAIDSDGWFHSGDLGFMDGEGRITFTSRLKDMLKVGGENVAAPEVEGHLLEHPAILMAQVVAAPDAQYTEVPAAYVMLRPASTATEDEVIRHCVGQMANFKVPRYVRFVEEWPMSGTKIKKHVLRDRIATELQGLGITQAPRLSSMNNREREKDATDG
jgi:fatty-acyl-CoA synthase